MRKPEDTDHSARSREALGFLARLTTEFTAVLNLPDLLDHVMRILREETGFHSCSLALLDLHRPEVLVIRAASGLRESFRGLSIPAREGLHGTVMATGKPLLIPDMDADPRVFRREPLIKCGVYAPLIVQGRQIGVLSAHQDRVGAFVDADLSLLTVVARYLAEAIEVARLHEQVKELAATDPLTGLANRRVFLDRLESEIARSHRARCFLSIVLLDLNGFKNINDVYGHARGDETLKRVGENLVRVIRHSDLASRFGGDEFTLLLPETTRSQAEEIIVRFRAKKIFIEGREGVEARLLTFAWGMATFPEDGSNPERLLQVADERLYALKHLQGDTST